MIVDGLEDLLGGNQQRGHFPDGHFKVHLGELEQSASRQSCSPSGIQSNAPLEETRHADTGASGWGRAKGGRAAMLTGQRDLRIHLLDPRRDGWTCAPVYLYPVSMLLSVVHACRSLSGEGYVITGERGAVPCMPEHLNT